MTFASGQLSQLCHRENLTISDKMNLLKTVEVVHHTNFSKNWKIIFQRW